MDGSRGLVVGGLWLGLLAVAPCACGRFAEDFETGAVCIEDQAYFSRFGLCAIAPVEDVDGDGIGDFVLGSTDGNRGRGLVALWSTARRRPIAEHSGEDERALNGANLWTLRGLRPLEYLCATEDNNHALLLLQRDGALVPFPGESQPKTGDSSSRAVCRFELPGDLRDGMCVIEALPESISIREYEVDGLSVRSNTARGRASVQFRRQEALDPARLAVLVLSSERPEPSDVLVVAVAGERRAAVGDPTDATSTRSGYVLYSVSTARAEVLWCSEFQSCGEFSAPSLAEAHLADGERKILVTADEDVRWFSEADGAREDGPNGVDWSRLDGKSEAPSGAEPALLGTPVLVTENDALEMPSAGPIASSGWARVRAFAEGHAELLSDRWFDGFVVATIIPGNHEAESSTLVVFQSYSRARAGSQIFLQPVRGRFDRPPR